MSRDDGCRDDGGRDDGGMDDGGSALQVGFNLRCQNKYLEGDLREAVGDITEELPLF